MRRPETSAIGCAPQPHGFPCFVPSTSLLSLFGCRGRRAPGQPHSSRALERLDVSICAILRDCKSRTSPLLGISHVAILRGSRGCRNDVCRSRMNERPPPTAAVDQCTNMTSRVSRLPAVAYYMGTFYQYTYTPFPCAFRG
jgi:hypothetical protein